MSWNQLEEAKSSLWKKYSRLPARSQVSHYPHWWAVRVPSAGRAIGYSTTRPPFRQRIVSPPLNLFVLWTKSNVLWAKSTILALTLTLTLTLLNFKITMFKKTMFYFWRKFNNVFLSLIKCPRHKEMFKSRNLRTWLNVRKPSFTWLDGLVDCAELQVGR